MRNEYYSSCIMYWNLYSNMCITKNPIYIAISFKSALQEKPLLELTYLHKIKPYINYIYFDFCSVATDVNKSIICHECQL